MKVRHALLLVALGSAGSGAGLAGATSDRLCSRAYGDVPPRAGPPLRLGIDPGLAGSVGGVQLPAAADDPERDLRAVKALRPPGHELVVRLNRLFWSDQGAGIARFKRLTARYTRAGFDVEIQVRYHPPAGSVGEISAWERYVRQVVDAFGANRRVTSMTITNEVNVTFSANTSDGYYRGAQDALIGGIETAQAEAARRHYRQLRFGFTYAYRFVPSQDAAFFAYLGAHGGPRFRHALGFVGLDFYPGTVYPPVLLPGDTYARELAQAAGVLRRCFAPMAGITPRVPIWITENGIPTGVLSEHRQAIALAQLVKAARAYSASFNITDYRWFNLRDSVARGAGKPGGGGVTFSSDGLLRSDYTRKPAFGVYRNLIARLGAGVPGLAKASGRTKPRG